ncbi:MAG TPA: zf-HC2 domain-containing protein [Candidatus Angelobacter sp.]
MEHNYAIENHTAERYLLHDLNEEERDAYEEHFFSCSACADEVKTAAEFLESAKRVVQDDAKAQLYGHAARHSIWGSWLNWRSMLHPMPAMACALLIFVAGFSIYQDSVVIPELRSLASAAPPIPGMTETQMREAQTIMVGESREQQKQQTVTKGASFYVQFDIPPAKSGSYESYVADIVTPRGVRKLSYTISKNEANAPIRVLVPAGTLESGKYFVVVQGVNSNGPESRVKGELVHLSFQLNIQD